MGSNDTLSPAAIGGLEQRERGGADDRGNAECDPGQVQMIDSVEREDIVGQQRLGVLGECGVRGEPAAPRDRRSAPPALNMSAVGPLARRTSGVIPS